MALGGYNYNNLDKLQTFTIPEVYEEITRFVAERDPETIAVNFSEWLPIADGISYTSYLKLQKIIGPKYSARMVSAIPPLFNLNIFVVWDLIFGSGLQIAGTFLTVVAAAWSVKRSTMLKELARGSDKKFPVFLYWWMGIAVPLAVLFVGTNWFLDSVLNVQLFS
jgi:hypothetical protein